MKTFKEVYATLPGNGWLSEAEARLLWQYASRAEGPILEVGCFEGRSTVLLASFGRPVYAVDPFAGFHSEDMDGFKTHRAFRRNLQERDIDNVKVFPERIETWLAQPVGMAYLDGDHSYDGTLSQVVKALECRARIVGIHDVNDSGGGAEVKRAAVEQFGPWTERVERLAVWVLR